MKNVTKPAIAIFSITIFVFLISTFNIAHAASCVSDNTTPDMIGILCPIFKLANIAILLGGGVFGAMIAVGAIKLAVSMGDPKGLEAAGKTWTYALIGAFIVIGSVAIVKILSTTFGLDFYDTGSLFSRAASGVSRFLEQMEVFGPSATSTGGSAQYNTPVNTPNFR